jgi:hypothetical protein
VDGDEERSGGIAVCEGTGDGAEASGDAAPAPGAVPLEREPDGDTTALDRAEGADPVEAADVGDEPASEELEPEVSAASDAALESVTVDEPEADAPDAQLDEQVSAVDGEPVAVGAPEGDGGPIADDTADGADDGDANPPEATLVPRRGPYLRRGATALVGVGVVALVVTAFSWVAPSPGTADRRFVEVARSLGHVVPPDAQALVISAARKICDRRDSHDTDQERRATALTSNEIAAVGAAFGAETRDFTTLALKTYCSS